MQTKTILITGVCGFIGYHLAKELAKDGHQVIGIDSMVPYYDMRLKSLRLNQLQSLITYYPLDVNNSKALHNLFEKHSIDVVYHLAAQAGVRDSITNPETYVNNNLIAFMRILEAVRHHTKRSCPLIYASSSSVYGNSDAIPFREGANTDYPTSLYGATKKANEALAYAYHYQYHMRCIGLRFFTVYGPLGRPDMAYYSFTDRITKREPITVYGDGKLKRDFTYITDIVDALKACMTLNSSWDIFNLGNHKPESVSDLVEIIEDLSGVDAIIEYKEKPKADVDITYSDNSHAKRLLGFEPKVSLKEGMKEFYQWYTSYMPAAKTQQSAQCDYSS